MPIPNPALAAGANIPYADFEDRIDLPWGNNEEASWLDYRCQVDVELDSGMVLHKTLPQSAMTVDSLATTTINDPLMDEETTGINLNSHSNSTDFIQRMATSTYRFTLRGRGLRVGYKIPIPALQKVGNATVTPEMQHAMNVIIGNFSGIPVWFASWEISYIVSAPLGQAVNDNDVIPFNPAYKIRPDAQLPVAVALPAAPATPITAPPAQIPAGGQVAPPNLGEFQGD